MPVSYAGNNRRRWSWVEVGGSGWKWVEVGGSGCHQDSGVVCVWGREEGAGGVILARYRQRPPDSSPSFRDRCSSAAD